MCQATDKQIIEVLKMETIPALGCTEPVACALACARCIDISTDEHFDMFRNISKCSSVEISIRTEWE